MRAALLPLIMASALPASAEAFTLGLPIDCTLGQTCFIQQYVDHDPGPGTQDFTCNGLSYDTHTGTDFALPSLTAMRAGVAVLASAPGQVTALRDGMPDTGLTPETAAQIEGRDCGNGVVIRHPDGWETQYCHLMQGSVTVTKGQMVETGTPLGLVGLSGNTEFPHVHLALRRNGQVVDPFDPDGRITCGAPDPETLWSAPIDYAPGALLNAGFTTGIPDYDSVKAGTAGLDTIASDAPALVVWGYAFGGRQGAVLRITITGPGGTITDHSETIDRNQAQFFRAAGRKTPPQGWPAGDYAASVSLIRDGLSLGSRSLALRVE